MSDFRVGLTGGIGSGKSTVGRLLAAAGFRVVDADLLVAALYRPGELGAARVAELFGSRFLKEEGGVDTTALADLVFHDAEARRRLEEAIHPLVRSAFDALASTSRGVVVLEATLLVEAGYAPDFDLIISVEADEGIRLPRAVARGADADDVRARMRAQGDGALRRAAADRLILNNGTLEGLESVCEGLVEDIRRLAAARHEQGLPEEQKTREASR